MVRPPTFPSLSACHRKDARRVHRLAPPGCVCFTPPLPPCRCLDRGWEQHSVVFPQRGRCLLPPRIQPKSARLGAHWESSHGVRVGVCVCVCLQVVCRRGEESGGGGAGCGASKDVKMCRISRFSMQGTSHKTGIKLGSTPFFSFAPSPPTHSSN